MPQVYADELFIEKFDDVMDDILDHNHNIYTFPGGRGGTKSSFIGMVIPLLIVQNPEINGICFRRYANTLKDSVYAEIHAGISRLGLNEFFYSKVSPLEITYRPTGQRILFRGFDEPEKIKSIKMQKGYIGVHWLEELSQYPGRRELRSAMQSIVRGGDIFWTFESFNPPITNSAWVNLDLQIPRKDRLITWSNYLDVPRDWLGEQFIEEAEYLKEADNLAYRHEYLGEAVGTGGNVFERIQVQEIPDSLIKKFDRIYQGVDWGWFPDPFAFVRLHYDRPRETIYLLDEYVMNKQSNEQTAKWIVDKKYHDVLTVCDSAEPKSVFDMRKAGIWVDGAIKGPGSVEYSMKWLQRRNIVVDPKRTPRALHELQNYEYERDKDGNIINGYPDKDNHCIDAIRYSLERLMRSNKAIA